MAAADFRDGVERHEIGPANSHHAQYVAAMNRPDWNIRLNAEPLVAPPATTLAAFITLVNDQLRRLEGYIAAAINTPEPCSEQCDATCSYFMGL